MPSLVLSNVRSLCNKCDELNVFASSIRPAIIALTETWLNQSITDEQISINSYSKPFRADRQDGRNGGGVCCFVRDDIYCKEVLNVLNPPKTIECLTLMFPNHRLILILVYIPPCLSSSANREIIEFLLNDIDKALDLLSESRLVLLGDFNNLQTSEIESLYSLTQIINFSTRGDSILDKIFMDAKVNDEYRNPIPCPAFGKSDHISIYVVPASEKTPESAKICKLFDYRKSNMDSLRSKLSSAAWECWYRMDADVDFKTEIFYDIIHDSMSSLPCVYVQMNPSDKPWLTPTLKHLINCKHQAFRSKNFPVFAHYQEKVKVEIIKAKNNYVRKMKKDAKGLWKVVKSLKSKKTPPINCLLNAYPSPTSAVEAINEALCKNFSSPPNWETIVGNFSSADDSWYPDISVEAVHKALSSLKANKSTGSDGLSPRILRDCADVLAEPLTHLLCLSFLYGQVPARWKIADISPIPKSKDTNIDNLRPISLLPVVSKILEEFIVISFFFGTLR